MQKKTYKFLCQLAIDTNANLKEVLIFENYTIAVSGIPKNYSVRTSDSHVACSGTIGDCVAFLRGINWLVNHNIKKNRSSHRIAVNNSLATAALSEDMYGYTSNGERNK